MLSGRIDVVVVVDAEVPPSTASAFECVITMDSETAASTVLSATEALPTEPVIVPMTIATQKGKPNMRVFSTPTTTNRANPMVSKIKKVFSSFTRYCLKIITKTRATAVTVEIREKDSN